MTKETAIKKILSYQNDYPCKDMIFVSDVIGVIERIFYDNNKKEKKLKKLVDNALDQIVGIKNV